MGTKQSIFNDPLYGFIAIEDPLILQIVEHPWFQRLRRINQLGLTNMVFPGANHNRFQHAIGAMHVMDRTLKILRNKGIIISQKEALAAKCAILLHDIGHGPFSHTMERSFIPINHEQLSLLFIQRLNRRLRGKLSMALQMFRGEYKRPFFHQLIASQLDVDRLDYLARDSFFCGVPEGRVNTGRIIEMINVHEDQIVLDEKGMYPVEHFLVARRLMYWQVYLHKTVLAAEHHLTNIFKRARSLALRGHELPCTGTLNNFLHLTITAEDFLQSPGLLRSFATLDDYDMISAIKDWANSDDPLLSLMCRRLLDRVLFKTIIQPKKIDGATLTTLRVKAARHFDLPVNQTKYLVFGAAVSNSAYSKNNARILIRLKEGRLTDFEKASDLPNIRALSGKVIKHFICYPKELENC